MSRNDPSRQKDHSCYVLIEKNAVKGEFLFMRFKQLMAVIFSAALVSSMVPAYGFADALDQEFEGSVPGYIDEQPELWEVQDNLISDITDTDVYAEELVAQEEATAPTATEEPEDDAVTPVVTEEPENNEIPPLATNEDEDVALDESEPNDLDPQDPESDRFFSGDELEEKMTVQDDNQSNIEDADSIESDSAIEEETPLGNEPEVIQSDEEVQIAHENQEASPEEPSESESQELEPNELETQELELSEPETQELQSNESELQESESQEPVSQELEDPWGEPTSQEEPSELNELSQEIAVEEINTATVTESEKETDPEASLEPLPADEESFQAVDPKEPPKTDITDVKEISEETVLEITEEVVQESVEGFVEETIIATVTGSNRFSGDIAIEPYVTDAGSFRNVRVRADGLQTMSYDEAVETIRENLAARNGTITIKIAIPDGNYNAYVTELLFAAFEEDGNPTHGDYIRWAWNTYNCQIRRDAEGNYTLTYTLTYNTTAEQEALVMEQVDIVLAELGVAGMTAHYDKARAIYDYICGHVSYGDTSQSIDYTAYAALINGSAVCEGYALLLYLMLGKSGVGVRMIAGLGGSVAHGWNIIQMDDGFWYNADATWDTSYYRAGTDYQYFLVGDENFPRHTRGNTSDGYTTDYDSEFFYAIYPMGTGLYSPPAARIDITDTAVIEVEDQYFDFWQPVTPQVNVTYDDIALYEDLDYTLSFDNNTDAGQATVTATGIGLYEGTVSQTFEIMPLSLENAVLQVEDQTYTGEALEPAVMVVLDEHELTPVTDYSVTYLENTEVGNAQFTVEGIDNFTSTANGTFAIVEAPITNAAVLLDQDTFIYSGSAYTPQVLSVELNGQTLTETQDYTVSYEDNINAGTAFVVITGTGNYTDTVRQPFGILQVNIAEATAATIPDQTWTGQAITLDKSAFVLSCNGIQLLEGTDYSVENTGFSNNVKVGTASVVVTAQGQNYTGVKTLNFTIVPKSTVLKASITSTAKAAAGATAYATVTATGADGAALSYQWQQSTDKKTWTASKLTGAKTETLTFKNASSDLYFRCKVTSADTRVAYTGSTKLILTGWQTGASGERYYYDSTGKVTVGWKKLSGSWYYFSTAGIMQTDWKKISGTYYYLGTDGKMQTGWIKWNDKWYYCASTGKMLTGWQKISNSWYYLNPSGGRMMTGWQTIDGARYYLGTNGKMQTGWIKLSGKYYYCASSGKMLTKWQKIDGYWYYLNPSGGARMTGWQKIDDIWYYFNTDGKMHTGWLTYKGKTYYCFSSGKMATGTQVIDGVTYHFHKTSGYLM